MATTTTNRPGTRAKVRMIRMSASKARVVLNLIRGKRVTEAAEILEYTERLAADAIAKCLQSAVANAVHNEDLSPEELFISACYADEGPTLKRFRPRARGRAGRIHKQTCHITIEVARFTDAELDEARKREELRSEGRQRRSSATGSAGGDRARRVARSRAAQAGDDAPAQETDETAADQVDDANAADQVEDANAADQVDDANAADQVEDANAADQVDDETAVDQVDDATVTAGADADVETPDPETTDEGPEAGSAQDADQADQDADQADGADEQEAAVATDEEPKAASEGDEEE